MSWARIEWRMAQAREIARDCEVSIAEALRSRSPAVWDGQWLDALARSCPGTVPPAVWRGIVAALGGYSAACRWARLYRIKIHAKGTRESAPSSQGPKEPE